MNGNGEGSPPLRLGELVPDVTLVDHEGEPWRFSDHRGRSTLVVLHRHLA